LSVFRYDPQDIPIAAKYLSESPGPEILWNDFLEPDAEEVAELYREIGSEESPAGRLF